MSNIHLTTKNRLYSCILCSPVEINNSVHNTMVCYRKTIHSKLCRSFSYLFYFT